MDCAYFREAIHRYIDSELGDAEVVAFQRHLGFCPECGRALQDLSLVRSALAGAGGVEVAAPTGFAERVVGLVSGLPNEAWEELLPGWQLGLRVPRQFAAPLRAAIYSGLAVGGYLLFRAQWQHARKTREVKA
jgi:anti-sigma factor RsiW